MTERWELTSSFVRASTLPVAVIAVAVGGLFIPCPVHLSAFSNAKDAVSFLNQEWTVTSVSIGFAVVLIVFAFQIVAAARPSANVRELTRVTPILLVLYMGVSALLVDGLVLLNIGYQAPAMWAASWATFVSASAIFLLAFLIALSLQAVDPQVIQQRRIAQVRKRAVAAINAEAVQRLALNLFLEDGKKFHYDVSPLNSIGPVRGDAESVRSTGTGIIADVRLDRLRRVARICERLSLPKPVITVLPGRTASEETRLALLPKGLSPRTYSQLETAFKKRRKSSSDPQSLLVAAADELHEEAMQAIDNGRTSAFQEVCKAQEELLVAFPAAWARLGQSFTQELATGLYPLAPGPLDPLGGHLYAQAIRAIGHGDREIASDAAGLPLTVAGRALQLNAHALSDRMLMVLSGIAAATGGAPPDSVGRQIHMAVLNHVSSYIDYLVFPQIEDSERPISARLEATKFLDEAAGNLSGIMKEAAEREDMEFFDQAVKKWRDFGKFWLGDHQYRIGTDDDPEYNLVAGVRSVMDRHRFILCAWQLKRLWSNPENRPAAHAFTSLASFSDVQHVVDIAEDVFDDRVSGLLFRWMMQELPEGEVHTFDTNIWVLRTLALIGIRASPSSDLKLRPTRWIFDNRDRLDSAIGEVQSALNLLSATATDDVRGASINFEAAVARAATEHGKILEQEIIDASLNEACLETFTNSTREAWEKRRTLVHLMNRSGALEEVDGDNNKAHLGYREYSSKEWFVTDRVADLENLGQRIGSLIADAEDKMIREIITRSKPLRRTSGDLNQRLRDAIKYMSRQGYQPAVIFVPWQAWLITSELKLQSFPKDQNTLMGVRHERLGLFEGLPLIEDRDVPSDRFILADLRAFATFRQWCPSGRAISR